MEIVRIVRGIVLAMSLVAPIRAGPVTDGRGAVAKAFRELSSIRPSVVEVGQLTPSDASDTLGQNFGSSAAIDGDWIAVGASNDSHVDYNSGAVYLFRRDDSGWVEHVKLVPDDAAWEGFFGGSVAMDGDRLVVVSSVNGSTEEGFRVGYVFVHEENGTPHDRSDDAWVQESKLLVPFGLFPLWLCCDGTTAVGITGDRIAIGAGRGGALGFSGFAAIFERVDGQWGYSTSLFGSDTVPGDGFGGQVGIGSERVAVAAYLANSGAGAVYIFRNDRSGWVEEAKVSSTDPAVRGFGNVISFDGNYLAVGPANIFRRNGRRWLEQANLTSPQGVYSFGGSLFITGRNLFVWARDSENDFWVLYFYERFGQEWTVRQKLVASDSSANEGYGGIFGRFGRYLVAGGALKVYVLRLDR